MFTLKSSTQLQLQTIPYNSLTISDLLGHGGYGDVYKATWHATSVAVKQLHLKTLPDHLKTEFDNEAQVMAQCQFPHIVSLYGVCTEIGHYSLVMEYLPKGSLYGVLQNKNEEINWDTRWTIAIDVGKGLSYLHSKNILHRDLKSLNILLTADCHAKICDFGLSKIKLETSSSSTKSKTGTIRWRAPETFKRGFKPANSMDIYSYGMVLWEISSRELPFADAPDEQTVISWINSGEKETISTDCPKAYGDIIQATWQEAGKRPTAEKIVSDLNNAKPKSYQNSKSLPIPAKKEKPYVEKSWHFDPETEPTGREKALNEGKPYQLLDATEKDKRKALEFYNHCPVPGYDIESVKVIYNKTFNTKFDSHLKTLQLRKGKDAFAPDWSSMSNPKLRQETYSLFEKMSYTDTDYPDVKLMPVWHGTKREYTDSIFQVGYSNLAKVDVGYFGRGIYSAYEAKYTYNVYVKNQDINGALILNWVAMFSPLPVINNGEFKPGRAATATKPWKPERHGDMCVLTGKPNNGKYDAHFVPVVQKSADSFDYVPCKDGQEPTYTEIVVFESAACLPRYLIELHSNKPQPGIPEPSSITSPKATPKEPIKKPIENLKITLENPQQKQKEHEQKLKQQEQELKKQQQEALGKHGIFALKTEIPKIGIKPLHPQPKSLQEPQPTEFAEALYDYVASDSSQLSSKKDDNTTQLINSAFFKSKEIGTVKALPKRELVIDLDMLGIKPPVK